MPLKPPPPAPGQLPPSRSLGVTVTTPPDTAAEVSQVEGVVVVDIAPAKLKRVLVQAPQYPLWVHRQKTLVPVGHPIPLDLDDWVQTQIDAGGLEVVNL